MKKAAKISLITLAAAVPAAGIATAVALICVKKNSGKAVVVTENDKQLVDKINEFTRKINYETMSFLLADLLEEEEINLQTQPLETSGVQFVWDSQPDEEHNYQTVFLMADDGSVAYAPKDYKLNSNQSKLWKMVTAPTPSVLMSATKAANYHADAFDGNCKYSQYLRDDQEFTNKDITFCSGLDTGIHSGFNLTFNKGIDFDEPVVINTYKSSLKVESELNDIHHYGNLSTLTINSLPEDEGTYAEFGSVDVRVVLKDGILDAKKDCNINDIVIEGAEAEKVIVQEDSSIGAVHTTTDATKETAQYIEKVGETQPEFVDPDPHSKTDEPYFYAGAGSKTHPYIISTKNQLIHASQEVNGTQETPEEPKPTLCFTLLNDVDLEGVEWTPIGNTSAHAYKGVFDGNGFTVSNLKISGTYSNKTLGFGLFGWTTADNANPNFTALSDFWDSETKKVKLENIIEYNTTKEQYNYTTVIKNVNVDNVNIQLDGDARCAAGIAGYAENTFIYNCNVVSGTIKANKSVGGVVGNIRGSVCMSCKAGADTTSQSKLEIKVNEYNVGGIVGICDYATRDSYIGLVDCSTTSKCEISVIDCKGGKTGGIVGYDDSSNVLAIEGCTNEAKIESVDTGGYDDACIAGICACGGYASIIANSMNKGQIIVQGTSKVKNAGGITTCPGQNTKLYNCVNYGNVVANAENSVAGIAAGCETSGLPTHVDWSLFEINSCWNQAETVSNTWYAEKKSDICDSVVGIQFVDTTFDNVQQINDIIKRAGSTSTQVTFKNCTLTDPSGSLVLPSNIATIYADKPICENITVNSNFSQINVYVPNQNITVTENSDCILYAYGANNKITINSGASVKSVYALGEGSEIINNGTVKRTIGLDNTAKKATNNGTCTNIRFGRCESYYEYVAATEMTFINNGTITGLADSSETVNDVISIRQSLVPPQITLINNGIIKYQNNGLSTPANLISFGRNSFGYVEGGNLVLECHENSKIISDHQNFFATTGDSRDNCKTILKWKNGYKVYEDGGTTPTTFDDIKTYYENAGTTVKITVSEIQ